MRALRRIVLVLFVLVYLVTCPLAILYALGYVVRPGAWSGLVKTGLIYVSSVPPEASVFVNRRHYARHTPTVIRGLLPGTYQVHVTLRHHQPWVRTVTVEAEKADVLDHILLLSKQPAREVLLPGAWRDLLPIPDTRFLLMTKSGALEDPVVFDTETGESWPLIPTGSPFRGGSVTFHAMVRGSPVVLLRLRLHHRESVIRAEFGRRRTRLADLSSLFPEKPQRVEWEPRAPQQLYALQAGDVHRLDSEAMAIYPQVAEGVRGYGVGDGALYVLTEDLSCQRVERDGRREEVPLEDPWIARRVFGERGTFRISVWPSDVLLFLGDGGELLTTRPPYRLVEGGVQGLAPDAARERLLVWRRDALGVLDLTALRRNEAATTVEPPVRWVFTEGRDIEQAFWVYEGSHALIRDHDTISLIELAAPAPQAVRRLLQVRPRSAVAYAEGTGRLYFLDRDTGSFCAMPLLPKREPRSSPEPADETDLPAPEVRGQVGLPAAQVKGQAGR